MIRELRPSDAPRLAALERQLFAEDNPWPEDMIAAAIRDVNCTYVGYVDADGQRLVGYAGIARQGPWDDPEWEIHTIGVDPDYQRRGIARRMLGELLAKADRRGGDVFLEVRVDNVPAISLYESYGFEGLGIRRGYYQPSGADALVMRRPSARSGEHTSSTSEENKT